MTKHSTTGSKAASRPSGRRTRPMDTQGMNPAYDYMCSYCGRIKFGPHAGQKVPAKDATYVRMYEGVPVSHGACDPPCKENTVARYIAEKKSPGRLPRAETDARNRTRTPVKAEAQLQREAKTAQAQYSRTGDPAALKRYQDLQARLKTGR